MSKLNKSNSSVNFYFDKDSQWMEAYNELRRIILECELEEELKWGKPCYTWKGKNVVLIHGFKEYCALLFHKGALINDKEGLLVRQTKNVQAARQMRFSNTTEVQEKEAFIREFLIHAKEIEEAGFEVKMKKTSDYDMAPEFQEALADSPPLEKAFKSLTPGRQRGYLLYFSGAKKAETRNSRIRKHIPRILNGKGLNDK